MDLNKNIENVPNNWFKTKFPEVARIYGDALNHGFKETLYIIKGIHENFFAATLGELGNPGAPMVFSKTDERFYGYDAAEGIFIAKSKQEIVVSLSRLMKQCADECHGNFNGLKCDVSSLVFYFGNANQLNGVIDKAKGLLAVADDYFNSNQKEFIACNNGMLRIADRTLLEFKPDYRRRNKLAVNFDPAAKCPQFLDKLLKPALSDIDVRLLQQWSGMCIMGVNLSQVIILLTGASGTGKGAFIRVLQGIIGQRNVAELRTDQLGGRFETSAYIGKVLLYGADVKPNFLNNANASYLKALVGGDPLNAEIKGVTGRPSIYGRYLVIVTSNCRLKVHLEGDQEAYRRRLIMVEYKNTKSDSVIVDFSERLLDTEAPGILNWMLDGRDILSLNEYVLKLSPEQKKVVDDLLLESESAMIFVQECLIREEPARLTTIECFNAYGMYCKARNWNPLLQSDANKLITQAITIVFAITQCHDIPGINGTSQRGWRGIKVK